MSDDEVADFLAETRKVQVATINRDGTPHLTTLFHAVHGGRIAFWTYAATQKVRNLERDPRLTCLVEAGEDYSVLRGVSMTGTAEIIRDAAAVRAVGFAVVRQMAGLPPDADESLLGAVGIAEIERQVAKRVAVLVTPLRTASWDHRKLA